MVDVTGYKMTCFSSNLMIDDVFMLKWSPKASAQNLSLVSERETMLTLPFPSLLVPTPYTKGGGGGGRLDYLDYRQPSQ